MDSFRCKMAFKRIMKLSNILKFFGNDINTFKKAENAVESDHVKNMSFEPDLMMVKGEILASTEDKTYNVEISIDETGGIVTASCTCPRKGKCHHIVALALFGYDNISVADQCTWNMPEQTDEPVKTVADLYPSKPYTALREPLSDEHLKSFREKLSGLGLGFSWLLQEENQEP